MPKTKCTNSPHLSHTVEKDSKILLSIGMETGRHPRTNQPAGRKTPKRSYQVTRKATPLMIPEGCV